MTEYFSFSDDTTCLWYRPYSMLSHVNTFCAEFLNWNIKILFTIIFISSFHDIEEAHISVVFEVWPPGNGQMDYVRYGSLFSMNVTSAEHYSDVMMGAMASRITSFTIVYSAVYSSADERQHQSFASLAFVSGLHRWPVNSAHKWPVTRKCFHLMTSSWMQKHHQRLTYVSLAIFCCCIDLFNFLTVFSMIYSIGHILRTYHRLVVCVILVIKRVDAASFGRWWYNVHNLKRVTWEVN